MEKIFLQIFIYCQIFANVLADDTSEESRPKYDVTLHQNWKLLNSDECGDSVSDRIIGGKNASLGAYPWIARIGYVGDKSRDIQFRCGGSLINNRYVVTAAHCATNLPNGMELGVIRLGEHNSETERDCDSIRNICAPPIQDFAPSKLIVHKDYGHPKFKNDIAIIRLDREANLNGWVTPICLPYDQLLTKTYIGEMGEVAGWGIYDLANPQSSIVLQTVKLPVVTIGQCIESFRRYASLNAKQMCVGGRVGHDSCGGDSGGPLMKVDVADGPPKYFFIGIVSFGAKHCGQTAMPAVYTRIAAYLDWILDNIVP